MPIDPAPIDPAGRPDRLGQVTTYVYDGHSRVVSVTDPSGPITYTVYDALGRPLTAPPGTGYTTYGAADEPLDSGPGPGRTTTTYSPDPHGRTADPPPPPDDEAPPDGPHVGG